MGKTSKNPSKQDNYLKKSLRDARENAEHVDIPTERLQFWETDLVYDPECVNYDASSEVVDTDKIYYD